MLLRRMMHHVREQNWFAVFLDFLIVIVGVAIGFQITAWDERRAERNAVKVYSDALVFDLYEEARLLAQLIEYFNTVSAYSREAEAHFADPRPENDGAFLVALYGASQYTRVARIDTTFQALASQGAGGMIENRLAYLMVRHYSSRNADALADLVLQSAYRQRLRRAMPTDVQNAIREQCGDIRDETGYVVALAAECDVDFEGLAIHDVAQDLRADVELRSDLALLIGSLDAYIADNRADLRVLEDGLSALRD